MKKILITFFLASFVFISCKKDTELQTDNGTSITPQNYYPIRVDLKDGRYTTISYNSSNLVQEFNNYAYDNSQDWKSVCYYNTNKLILINGYKSGDTLTYKNKITYSGNQADSILVYYDTYGIGDFDLVQSDILTYNGDKIISIIENTNSYMYKIEYTWDLNNIIEEVKTHYEPSVSTWYPDYKIEYEYDSLRNPLHNIGLNVLLDIYYLSENNVIKKRFYDGQNILNEYNSIDYKLEYDSLENKIKSTFINLSGDTTEIETYSYSFW